jgi:alpha-tubulin suppressor-like RCC1 family protein
MPTPPPSCTDHIKNGTETDVDCGGHTCQPCANGLACMVSTDCMSRACANKTCWPASCNDGINNGGESDVDCGGPCPGCAVGLVCSNAGDCASGVCANSICQAPTCSDGVKNGDETGIDCGDDCPACADGSGCAVPTDCQSGVCTATICQGPTCSDGVKNGGESDVDCGGPCPPCAKLGMGCSAPSDCASGACSRSKCVGATCTNGITDGNETDVDCGGDQCLRCADGKSCLVATDCTSLVCADRGLGLQCQVPTCNDEVKNGQETDVDCGGPCPACQLGEACKLLSDCAGGACVQSHCVGVQAMGLALGAEHTCARFNNGRVRCWGYGADGRLGYGNTTNLGDRPGEMPPNNVNVGADVIDVVCGAAHTCALTAAGNVRCWGRGREGELGYGNTSNLGDSAPPATAGDVDVGGTVAQISAGSFHTCILLSTGRVRCWGHGANGQLGYGSTANVGDTQAPAMAGDVPLAGKAVEVAAGGDHTCALLKSGSVQCWGLGSLGQLGYGSNISLGAQANEMPPPFVPVGDVVKHVSAGWAHTCAIVSSGSVRCWGYGADGRLGYGSTTNVGDGSAEMPPADVLVGDTVQQVSAGGDHTCALLTAGSVRCWGRGTSGQLGYANTLSVGVDETPADAGDINVGTPAPLQVIAGKANEGAHTCALLSDGSVRCWGGGEYGRLGYGDTLSVGAQQAPANAGNVVVLP